MDEYKRFREFPFITIHYYKQNVNTNFKKNKKSIDELNTGIAQLNGNLENVCIRMMTFTNADNTPKNVYRSKIPEEFLGKIAGIFAQVSGGGTCGGCSLTVLSLKAD